MLELRDVCKTYQTKKGKKNSVLKNISIQFGQKGMTFILGPSGSGKSTLLNILGGLDQYDSGDMLICGNSTKKFSIKDYDNYRNNYIGFVFQDFNIIEDYTVYENIILPLKLQNKTVDNTYIEQLLKNLEILEYKNRMVNELSGGQKQRVAIARALVKRPKIILADEPTGNLDSKTGMEVMNLLKKISKDTLVIMVTHNREYALEYANRIIEINDGIITKDTKDKNMEMDSLRYEQVKSHLPLLDALKLGFCSLKSKKLKLFFTIFLISFSTLFLAVSYIIFTYDIDENHVNILLENDIHNVEIKKYMRGEKVNWQRDLKEKDIQNIESKVNVNHALVYSLTNEPNLIRFFKLNIYQPQDLLNDPPAEETDMYTAYSSKIQIVELDDFKLLNNYKITGKYPSKDNEIMISNYVADILIKNGLYPYESNEVWIPKNYEELISSNQLLHFGSYNSVKIVGVIHYDLEEYDKLKNLYEKDATQVDRNLREKLNQNVENVYNKVFVKKGFIDHLSSFEYISNLDNTNIYYAKMDEKKDLQNNLNVLDSDIEYYDGTSFKKINSLEKDEMLISIFDVIENKEEYINGLEAYKNKSPYKSELELEKEYIMENIDLKDIIGKNVKLDIYENSSYVIRSRDIPTNTINNIKIIGMNGLSSTNSISNLFSKEVLGIYLDNYVKVDSVMLFDLDHNQIKKYEKLFPINSDYGIYSLYTTEVESYGRAIEGFKPYVNMITIILLIFSMILICNFMFTSISSRKKDIGILKSLGAKNIDVVKIFSLEGMILSIISTIISIIILILFFKLINETTMYTANTIINPFHVQFNLCILIFMYISSMIMISSLFPLLKISKMKPIDAILNK